MNKYGIRGLPHAWFSSYITNRKQYVKIGNTESSLKTITCGIPQGSTLGPLLFLLYINDLPNSSSFVVTKSINLLYQGGRFRACCIKGKN